MEGTRADTKRVAAGGAKTRLPLMAGPMIWYALAGISVIVALMIFLFADPADQIRRYTIAIFIGLWAPMFGILGIRAELMELREDLLKKEERRRGM
jgi:hypothetical protein